METTQNHAVVAAKAEFLRAKDRVVKAIDTTAEDRLCWSPSPTARTPLEVAAHCAIMLPLMMAWLQGKPHPFGDMEAMDTKARQDEAAFTTREQVMSALDTHCAAYTNWLESLTPEQLETPVGFGEMSFPLTDAITFAADHFRGHASQIDYIQTIYGDRDFHMS